MYYKLNMLARLYFTNIVANASELDTDLFDVKFTKYLQKIWLCEEPSGIGCKCAIRGNEKTSIVSLVTFWWAILLCEILQFPKDISCLSWYKLRYMYEEVWNKEKKYNADIVF